MEKLGASFVFLCLTMVCYGQSDFRKGYIVTHEMDTLKGLVDFRQGAAAFASCNFKLSNDAKTITYQPDQIAGYGFVNDKYFVSRQVETAGNKKLVFLEVIVRGMASLFRFERIYFVEKDSQGLHSLENQSDEAYVDGKKVIRTSNVHVSTFNMLFFDCAELRSKMKSFNPSERVLTGLVESYNQCKGEPGVTFKASKPWVKTHVAIAAGVSPTKVRGNDVDPTDDVFVEYEVPNTPVASISFDFVSPRLNENFSFHTGLLYQQVKYYGYGLVERPYGSNRIYVSLEAHSIKIPLGLRYTFAGTKFTPFLNAGILATFLLRGGGSLIRETELHGVVETFQNYLSMEPRRAGYWAGAGGIIRLPYRFDGLIELRYENSKAHFMTLVDCQVTSLQLAIGIRTK